MTEENFDCVVIGGGPAGVAAATSLAGFGHKVALVEKDQFPRFHIGESLLPYMGGIFRQEDSWNFLRDSGLFVEKHGAEFTGSTGQVHRVDFTAQGAGRAHTTLQVERSKFDKIRLERAVTAGVTLLQGWEVLDVLTNAHDHVQGVIVERAGEQKIFMLPGQ